VFVAGGLSTPWKSGIIYQAIRPHDRLSRFATSRSNALTLFAMLSGLILRGANPSLRRARSGWRSGESAFAFCRFQLGWGWTYILGVWVGVIAEPTCSEFFRVFNRFV